MRIYSLLALKVTVFGLILNSCVVRLRNPGPINGTVQLEPYVYMDQIEVTVGAWLSYMNWIARNHGRDSMMKLIPRREHLKKEAFEFLESSSKQFPLFALPQYACTVEGYRQFRKFKSKPCIWSMFPITGISFKQANQFCAWRTRHDGLGIYEFSLPSREEWKRMARAGMKNPNEQVADSMCADKCQLFNFYSPKFKWTEMQQSGQYFPNKLNVYEVFGNAAEMTSEPQVAVGGHFRLYASQCSIDSVQQYTQPEEWLGFRCIMKNKAKRSSN